MPKLIQVIYSSAATKRLETEELNQLLEQARRNNQRLDVTGMLLYTEGSFFQILEGEPDTVHSLFTTIAQDNRHTQITTIIMEPISSRSFSEWSMGYTDLPPEAADEILGVNDFFNAGRSFTELDSSRAKKILAAFKLGSWRAQLVEHPMSVITMKSTTSQDKRKKASIQQSPQTNYSFAYQPIVHVPSRSIFSYEALIRGLNQEPAKAVLQQVPPSEIHEFDEQLRVRAIKLAAQLGLSTRINLNFLPQGIESSPTALSSVLTAASEYGIKPEQIVLEILEREIIKDPDYFNAAINTYRENGLTLAIDDFGAGYAGLNLLADFQPNLIKLDMNLVRGIETRGPRQAIVLGILRTCIDLGIDVIAEGVETVGEYSWLRKEGIELFQGLLFAAPAFEALEDSFNMPDE